MKNTILILVILLGSTSLFAQAPQAINYQAVARNASGQQLVNTNLGLQFTFLQGSPSGTVVYRETFNVTSNLLGLYNIQLGTGAPQTGTFNTINWASGPYFVEVGLDPNGGTTYNTMGTSQLISVPYALYAENVGNTDDADADSTNEIQTLSQSGSIATLSDGGGSISIDDADADPTNELQQLSWDSTNQEISLSNGNTVQLTGLQSTGSGGQLQGNGSVAFYAEKFPEDWSDTWTYSSIILENGELMNWGENLESMFGIGFQGNDNINTEPIWTPMKDSVISVIHNYQTSYWITSTKDLYAAGFDDQGQVGIGIGGGTTRYPRKVSTIFNVKKVVVSGGSTSGPRRPSACALLEDSTVWCWGEGAHYQLGNGTTTDMHVPTQAGQSIGLNDVTDIDMGGGTHASVVVVRNDTSLWGWGYNEFEQVGVYVSPMSIDTPTLVYSSPDTILKVISIYDDVYHTRVMLKSDGTVWTWGYNGSGQLGNTSNPVNALAQVDGINNAVDIAGGGGKWGTVYVILADSTIRCWGNNQQGQLGGGSLPQQSFAVDPGLTGVKKIVVSGKTNSSDPTGGGHTVNILKYDGTVFSLGNNSDGAFGTGVPTNSPITAEQALGICNAVDIYSGGTNSQTHCCAILADGRVVCWGENAKGQLGNKRTRDSFVPSRVIGINQ